MMYNTKNPIEAQDLKIKIGKLVGKGAMVEVTEKRPRSLKTNAYLHAILSYFGLQTGNTLDEAKNLYYKREVNADLFVRRKHDRLLGMEREYLRSTTELTQDEMSDSIDRFRAWSKEVAEIYIPSAEEHIALLHIQHDVERAKRFLQYVYP